VVLDGVGEGGRTAYLIEGQRSGTLDEGKLLERSEGSYVGASLALENSAPLTQSLRREKP
jgi:hypothetical protein